MFCRNHKTHTHQIMYFWNIKNKTRIQKIEPILIFKRRWKDNSTHNYQSTLLTVAISWTHVFRMAQNITQNHSYNINIYIYMYIVRKANGRTSTSGWKSISRGRGNHATHVRENSEKNTRVGIVLCWTTMCRMGVSEW